MIRKGRPFCVFIAEGDRVQSALQDLLYCGVVIQSIEAGPLNGSDQSLFAYFLFLRKDAHTTAVGQLRVDGPVQNMGDIIPDYRSNGG